MNFYQAPIVRTLYTATKSTTSVAIPEVPAAAAFVAPGISHGRNITVFFETPGWPTAASKIQVRGTALSGSVGNLAAAPNVCLSDADSYLFLRGASVYANNSTPANGMHVVYSAYLDNVVPSSARASAANSYWVRPGDSFTFTNPYTSSAGTNLGTDGTRSNAIITSVRQKNSGNKLLIEFSVPIVQTAVNGYAGGSAANWAGRDFVFWQGAAIGSATASKGLSYHQVSTTVTEASTSAWTATLSGAVNLTYTAANRPGLLPASSGSDAEMVDPSKMLICNSASLAVTGRQMGVVPSGTAPTNYNTDFTFEHVSDFAQGSVPYRCISFNATGDWIIELLVHPLH